MLQGLPVQKLHGDEKTSVMFADFVDGADVGMIKGRRGAGFAAETFQRQAVLRDIFGKELEGDKAAKLGVFSFVDNTHPPAAELLYDAVVRDGLPNHWRESYVGERGKSMKAGTDHKKCVQVVAK